jgi:replication-associated recombination protein RarA
MADGDGRYLLNLAEQVALLPADTPAARSRAAGRAGAAPRAALRQGAGEHYNLISRAA